MESILKKGQYSWVRAVYIPLIDSIGTCCDNCGRLISNIVTVKHEDGTNYTIGQDCAKTLFNKQENNNINISIKKDKLNQQRKNKAILNLIDIEAIDAAKKQGLPNKINNPEQIKKYNDILIKISQKYGQINPPILDINGGYIIYFY